MKPEDIERIKELINMNDFYKIKLIHLVTQLSEESCCNIIAGIYDRLGRGAELANEKSALALMRNKDWSEELHPRETDGKFAPKGSGETHSPKNETSHVEHSSDGMRDPSDFSEPSEQFEKIAHSARFPMQTVEEIRKEMRRQGDDYSDTADVVPTNVIWNQKSRVWRCYQDYKDSKLVEKHLKEATKLILSGKNPKSYDAREKLLAEMMKIEEEGEIHPNNRPGWYLKITKSGYEANEPLLDQIDLSKKIQQLGMSSQEKKVNQRRAEKYLEIADEMDEIEEKYGDREKMRGFKWPDTEEGRAARKRYRNLKSKKRILKKQVDWEKYEAPEDEGPQPSADYDEDVEFPRHEKQPSGSDAKNPYEEGTDSHYAFKYPDFDEHGKESLVDYLKRGGRVRGEGHNPYEFGTDSYFAWRFPDFDEQGEETLEEYVRRGGRVR